MERTPVLSVGLIKPKIVVLCAVRNEEWILRHFLCACSRFADHVLVADQNSYDKTLQICSDFPKVTRIVNDSREFNEGDRIQLLIREARERFGLGNVLLALDADEIPVNTLQSEQQWRTIREIEPGVILRFSKPDIDIDGQTLVDMGSIWKLGYIDDGAEHTAAKIHAQRVPSPADAPIFDAADISFLHVNLIRPDALRAKRRMYCALENAQGISSLRRRLLAYNRFIDFSTSGSTRTITREWIDALAADGLHLSDVPEEPPFWQDYEVLRLFRIHGMKRFWLDDLWDADWAQISHRCRMAGWDETPEKLKFPPLYIRLISRILQLIYQAASRAKHAIKSFGGLFGKA
ncbi:MAG: glycosyltransferase family 2 protein [Planctomycetota bacterium]